jgi:hypothetical protein
MGDDDLRGKDAWDRLEWESERRSNWEGIASAAAWGDEQAAMRMLKYARFCIHNSSDIPGPVQTYLLECFDEAIREGSTEHAFNLKARDGRGKKSDQYMRQWRDSQLALAVQYHRDQGDSLKVACHKVADSEQPMENRLGRVGFSAVKSAYSKFFPGG